MPAFGSQPGLPAFTAANNKIFMDGKPIRLRGANWFGFEGANAVVDGLWERPMSEYVGFLASQGFNAVRVPLAADALTSLMDHPCMALGENRMAARGNNPDFLGVSYVDELAQLVKTRTRQA